MYLIKKFLVVENEFFEVWYDIAIGELLNSETATQWVSLLEAAREYCNIKQHQFIYTQCTVLWTNKKSKKCVPSVTGIAYRFDWVTIESFLLDSKMPILYNTPNGTN